MIKANEIPSYNQDTHKETETQLSRPSNVTRFLRFKQIIGDRKAQPPIEPIIPVSSSSWWAGVKAGRFPSPVKIGPHTTAWRWEDIQVLLDQLDTKGYV
jgi:prophage regulatory protein